MPVPNEAEVNVTGPPFRALGQALLQLAAIVAPAAWFLPLAALERISRPREYEIDVADPSVLGFFTLMSLAVLPVLVCLVTIFGALSPARLPVSLPRTAAQLGVLYLSTMALMLTGRRLLTLPWTVALGLALFAVIPLLLSLLLRWFRWRLVRSRDSESLAAGTDRFQFRLADVFVWTTLIAAFLGLGTALLSRFDKEPSGLEGLGPVIVFAICMVLCVPVGLLSVILTWLVLVERRRLARWLVSLGLATLWIGYSIYVVSMDINPETYSMLITPPALALPGLALLGLARAAGWRMQRRPRRS